MLQGKTSLIQGHAVVRQLGVRTNSQIAEIFGLTGSAVSRRVGVLKSKAVNYKSIRKNSIHKINKRDLTPILYQGPAKSKAGVSDFRPQVFDQERRVVY
jgi:hypothetical protein